MVADVELTADERGGLAEKLNDAASQLDDLIEKAPTDEDAKTLDGKATALRNYAATLLAQAIILRKNDIGLDADLLGNAVEHCKVVIGRIADAKKAIRVAAALLGFVPILTTGNVPNIVKAGIALDKSLSDIEHGAA